MAQIILSTGNIVSGGPSIIRKPGAYRSNLELTNSLRSNFLAAQQDYADHADHSGADTGASSFPAADEPIGDNGTTTTSITNGNAHGNTDTTPSSLPVWTAHQDGVIFVPRIDWPEAGLQEESSEYDITVKLFFLPTAPVAARPQYVREALDLVLKELDVRAVDLLVVSFPGMSFDGDCEWEADKRNALQGNDDDEAATWPAVEELQRRGLVRSLGIAEFGSAKLARFLTRVQIPPRVDQINIKNCCNVPPPLVKIAKEQGIDLLVHSDCTDILSKGTLRELLGPGPRGAGVLADTETGSGGLQGDLVPQWVVKYTAVVRDRGVIENKGYFASAALVQD
ncbi:NADP-dependent oxidoreductase domain-containing protein [Podospora appendiculata]|uniref:GCS light chain n=1 Tax=Podospora appendiculata TaxID=314037 RepID=A0AAE1CAF6_9PEZI|nr:NADP-dependent oxidoreductase domain-containing protein [Podospora appendiculata]